MSIIFYNSNWGVLVNENRFASQMNSYVVLQIVSDGIYRSVEHRATVNSVKERLSIAKFYSPKLDGDIVDT